MAVNRVDFGGNTLIDLTGDTLELPEQLLKGIIAHAKDGTPIEGTLEAGGGGSCNIVSGTVSWADIPTSIVSTEFVHNLGRIPKLFLIYPAFDITSSINKSVGVFFLSTENIGSFARNSKTSGLRLYNNSSDTLLQSPISDSKNLGVYADEIKLLFNTYLDSLFTVTAGDLYNWIIVG